MDATPSASPPSGALQFPDVPKLELDEVIEQLVDRAREVQRSQGRLRALLHAIETVTGDLALDVVLRNVVTAACRLAGARYGALGVIGFSGGLERFIHVGMDAPTAAAIGHLPEGHGLLGAITNEGRAIRLERLADDARAAGFPDGHPPMDSFLGVPVRVRGVVFGNLYLTDSAVGAFSAEDEELVGALALAAGAAVHNARLFEESQLQQRWLAASAEISSHVLSTDGEDPLRLIARRAIEIADADVVTVGLLTAEGADLVIEIAVGDAVDGLLGRRFGTATGLLARLLEQRAPLVLDAPEQDDAFARHGAGVDVDVGPLMALPLAHDQRLRGVLTLARVRGKRPFSDVDLGMVTAFASHATVALELADARAAKQRLIMLEDRERIARDLHDHVIQELFAIGLGLEAMAARPDTNEAVSQRLQQRVVAIDRTIRQIRTTIFELRGPLDGSADGTRSRTLEIARDLTAALGFEPHVTFSGLVDTLPAGLVDDLAAVIREALANVAKHARASRVTVDVAVVSDTVTVVVADDGIGYSESGRRSGLSNLRVRAERHQGTFDVLAGSGGGTTAIWKAVVS